MFSGIIDGVGTVAEVGRREGGVLLGIAVPEGYRGLAPGTSVAVNGTCLTVIRAEADRLYFDAVGATVHRTRLGAIEPGAKVNLERSLTLGGAIDGHLVTGHVDAVGEVAGLRPGDGAVYYDIRVPAPLMPQIALRGSVAVDGVSLTVADVRDDVFTVSIVPYTIEHTVFGTYRAGTPVHLETDVLAKYVERALAARPAAAEGRS